MEKMEIVLNHREKYVTKNLKKFTCMPLKESPKTVCYLWKNITTEYQLEFAFIF